MEALDRSFENVCELDLVFHFDDVRMDIMVGRHTFTHTLDQVHHILAEMIQGGLVLETNVEEIAQAGM